jgi:Ala-tRNA(Pro) deacylase
MPVTQLKEFLDKNKVKYVSIRHSTAYTAQEVAASAHVKGRNMAKTVIVQIDGKIALAVLPAKYQIDLDKLKKSCNGNLYKLPVYADETLKKDEEIAFNACSHTELIQIAYKDFERLVKPKFCQFSVLV